MYLQKVRALLTIGVVSILGISMFTGGHAGAIERPQGSCQDIHLAVALADGQPADQMASGTLCTPLHWQPKHQIDVLVHGASYNKNYWDWPQNNGYYSYVNDTLAAGRATFNYDQIGTGGSSHPLSTDISVSSDAFVLHQVINWARNQHQYAAYNVTGHSYGSIVAIHEAGTYHDVSSLVLTGNTHAINATSSATTLADFYPAAQDPQFSAQNLDSGYITSRPGTKRPLFYGGLIDNNNVAYDEAHKDTISLNAVGTSFTDTSAPAATNISNSITAPVLEIIGQQDFLFCGPGAVVDCNSTAAVTAYETPYFAHAASFTAKIVPDTGHDLALHPTAPLSFAAINAWVRTH